MMLWTAGILLGLGLVWFAVAVAVPFWQVRKVIEDDSIRRIDLVKAWSGRRHADGRVDRFLEYQRRDSSADARAYLCRRLCGNPVDDVELNVVLTPRRLSADEQAEAAWKLGLYLSLAGQHAQSRAQAIYALSVCGRAGIPPLLKLLSSPAPDIRCQAAWALGEVGAYAEAAMPALHALQQDPDEDVRIAVKDALRRIAAGSDAAP